MKITNKILSITLIIILSFVLVMIIASRVIIDRESWDEEWDVSDSETTTEYYDLSDFTDVRTSGNWQLKLYRDDTYQVKIEAPNYIMNDIEVEKSGKTLDISLKWKRKIRRGSLKAGISLPNLTKIKLNNGSTVEFSDFDMDDLDIRTSGAGSITGTNNTIQNLYISSTGATHINLRRSSITNADLHITGAGSIELTMAGGDLKGSVTGATRVVYYGDVKTQNIRTSGAVSVRKK